jgi:hypothetical protein
VLYDMPGVGLRRGAPPSPDTPPDTVVDGWARLLAAGVPVVALHHALAGWPAWGRYADILGGRFHYGPGRWRDRDWPDSGWCHDVPQTLGVADPEHPVCAGLPPSFTLTDETYLCPVFEHEVTPLLVTDASRSDRDHFSARHAVLGRGGSNDAWAHPPGSALAAWTWTVRRSPVVYVQPGDGPHAFANASYRRLLSNAVVWLAGRRT